MRLKKYLTFTSVIWTLVVLFAFHALCWPLVQNAWAASHWEAVPCKLLHERKGYTFLYGNKAYIATRSDFWERADTHASETGVIARNFDRTCYIAPGDPTNAVLNLDAQRHPERALRYLDRVVMAALVAGILTYALRRKSPPPKPKASSGSEGK